MKKVITLFTVLVLVISMLCFPIHATDDLNPMDSRYLSPQILEKFDLDETELLVKCYASVITWDFNDYTNIDEILANAFGVVYLQKKFSDPVLYASEFDKNGEWIEGIPTGVNGVNFYQQTLHELQTGEAIKTISADITVQSLYYLWGENNRMGTAIYYETNMGDYVYYRQHGVGELLFPAEAFFEYQKAICETMFAYPDANSGSEIGNPWDLSVYDYRSPDFNPNTPFPKQASTTPAESSIDPILLWTGIAAGVLLLATISAFFIIKARHKSSVTVEEG